jgi:hypothetical protein
MTADRCPKDGYKLVSGVCPICRWEAPVEMPFLPAEVLAIRVDRSMFITPQHYAAWVSGMPLRRHIPGRKKIDRDLRELVYREHGRKCVECGRTDYLTVDHIIPVALGGSTRLSNFRPLCEPHNRAYWARCFSSYLRALDRYLAKVAA